MFSGNFKMAVSSLRSAKWRSVLTVIGVIVGVVSVVTTVALGEGIKRQLVTQIKQLSTNVITVRPGKIVERDQSGRIVKVNVTSSYNYASGSLPLRDLEAIKSTAGVKSVIPIGLISGSVKADNKEYSGASIVATSSDMPAALNTKIAYGTFFSSDDKNLPVAVIGSAVANELFDESAPVGMTLTIHGQDFVVDGILENVSASPIAIGPDFNKSIIIPFEAAQNLTGGNTQLAEVLAMSDDPNQVDQTVAAINKRLLTSHGQQNDFTVLRQDENLIVTNNVLNTLTAFIAGIAAISLIVGGIGIMNIMLVSVTERTKEIGVRKALGATNRQILGQFLVEAVVLSCTGAILGIIISGFIVVVIRLTTHLQPVITWPIVLAACLVAIVIGSIFGLTPAIKAARKDPIEALRYE